MAPCFLVCVIGSDCSLFRDLPYNYRAFSRGLFFDPADQAAKMKKIGGKLDSIGSRWYG